MCFLYRQKQKDVFESVCRIPMITSAKEEQRMIATCRKVSCILSQSNGPLTKVCVRSAAAEAELSGVLVCTKGSTVSLYWKQ